MLAGLPRPFSLSTALLKPPTFESWLTYSMDDISSPTCTFRPRSKPATSCSNSRTSKYSPKTLSNAILMSFCTTRSSLMSPTVSSSIFPHVEAIIAGRSLTRGATCRSFSRKARWLADIIAAPCQLRNFRNYLLHKLGEDNIHPFGDEVVILQFHDLNLVFGRTRVVGTNLRANTILQRRNNAATVRIILRVGAGDNVHV